MGADGDCTVSVSDELNPPSDPALTPVCVRPISGLDLAVRSDVLAVEESLEIRLSCDVDRRRVHRAVSTTMRTPAHDRELAVGFLFTEGIIVAREQVAGVRACGVGTPIPGPAWRVPLLVDHLTQR
jgi:FdhD protein